MKYRFSPFAALLLSLLTVSCSRTINARLMTYNVHNCVGMDDSLSCKRVADVILRENVEAVALQELDSLTRRFPEQDMLKNLATLTGMHATFGPSINFMGGKYGIGILTAEKPLSHKRIPLPCRSEPRSLLIVELEKYYFCCTHLSLHAEDRAASATIIAEELSKLNKPAVIAGDFNASTEEECMQLIKREFHIFNSGGYPTYPADKPNIEIDYICLHKGLAPKATEVEYYVAKAAVESDHRPVVSEISFKQR